MQRIYADRYGFEPTSQVVKPVHVANQLARSLTGRTYKSSALARTLRRWILDQKTGHEEERNPNAGILESYSNAFTSKKPGGAVVADDLTALRTLMRDVLAADGAVFGDPDKSSYTMANERFATRDPSDHRAGALLASLLTAGGDGAAANSLRNLLATEDDPWTSLALPLLALADVRNEETMPPFEGLLDIGEDGELRSAVLRRLRHSFDRLASFDQAHGSKLNSLRRLVLFGCFAIHIHLVSRWSESSSGAPRPPILLDLFDGSRPALRDASRATLRAAGQAIEAFLIAACSESLNGAAVDPAAYIATLSGKTKQSVETRFRAYLQSDPTDALAQAIVEEAFDAFRGSPIAFLTELGRRAGYLTPWANEGRGGRLQKRYGLTAEFLEILIGATVQPNEPVDFGEFMDRLRDNFGIVLGRQGDADVIRRNNLGAKQFGTPVALNEEDLRLNVQRMRKLIEESGYAKTYADGRTIVTTAPEADR
jgi:hypothetical protein